MEATINPSNITFRLMVVAKVVEKMKETPEANVNDVFDGTWNALLMAFKRRYEDNEETIG